jgi:hypothetical protein
MEVGTMEVGPMVIGSWYDSIVDVVMLVGALVGRAVVVNAVRVAVGATVESLVVVIVVGGVVGGGVTNGVDPGLGDTGAGLVVGASVGSELLVHPPMPQITPATAAPVNRNKASTPNTNHLNPPELSGLSVRDRFLSLAPVAVLMSTFFFLLPCSSSRQLFGWCDSGRRITSLVTQLVPDDLGLVVAVNMEVGRLSELEQALGLALFISRPMS